MGKISDRRYPPPINGADWTMSASDVVQSALSLALSRHVPGWPGAEDEQMERVAFEIIVALDQPQVKAKSR